MSDLPHLRIARARRARRIVLLVAATAAASAITTPALAVVNNPPRAAHQIISFPERDFVSATGYDPATQVTFEVWRNNHRIGVSDPITPAAPDGLVEANHPGGVCWVGSTPDILPGDSVRVVEADGVTADETTTANVTAQPAIVGPGGTLVVHGTAADAAGNPLPLAEIEQRIVANKQAFSNGRRTLRASSAGIDGVLNYDSATNPAAPPTAWTATYTLPAADVARATDPALNNETRILWLGAGAVGTEQTIFETAIDPIAGGFGGGPTPPCTAPAATTAILGMSRSVVNAANVGQPLVLDGVAVLAETDHVQVQVGAAVQTVAVTPDAVGAPNGTWSVSIPSADLAALPEGTSTVTVTYQGTAPRTPQTRTLTKDTIAPAAPTATPAAGTYPFTQAVALSDADQSAGIFFTTDGAAPTASSVRFTSQISISASQTIRAIAVDPAGNPSAISTFPFVIGALAAIPAPATGPGVVVAGKSVSQRIAPIAQITAASRISRARLRAKGLRLTLRIGSTAHVVRIRVFRADRNGRPTGKPLASVFRLPAGAGVLRVTLRSPSLLARMRPGRYVVQVSGGDSRATLEAPLTKLVTVTR